MYGGSDVFRERPFGILMDTMGMIALGECEVNDIDGGESCIRVRR